MSDDAAQLPRAKDPDLVRWARELGVTYEEVLSTLDYAGPTFKDAGVHLTLVEMRGSPTDRPAPSHRDSGSTPGALAPGIATATQLPR